MNDAPNVVMARLVKEIREAKGDDEGELAKETDRLVFLVAGRQCWQGRGEER